MSALESTGTSRKTEEQYGNMKRLLGGDFLFPPKRMKNKEARSAEEGRNDIKNPHQRR